MTSSAWFTLVLPYESWADLFSRVTATTGPRTLCNACGLMYANKGVMRPPDRKTRRQVHNLIL